MNLVRSAISASHFQIEQTEFSKGMLNGAMTAINYSRGLVQLWHIHRALESCATLCPEVSDFFTEEMVRSETIRRDLQAFGFSTDTFEQMIETTAIVEQMKDWALESPYSILGCIYILEGSGSWRIFGITVAYFSESWIQKSFQCIENNESVLVSTHTSAGKTVVAL